MGSFTGIRPIWVVISLLVGTYIGGVLGLLIAVPVAGFIKDVIDGWASVADFTDNPVEGEQVKEILTKESASQ